MFNPNRSYYEVCVTMRGTVVICAHDKDEALDEFYMMSNSELVESIDDIEVEDVSEQ